jgi:hypothetical protein
MHENSLYTKTAAGVDELKSRTRALPPRLRTMLIMVDGQRTLAQLQHAAAGLGAPSDFLEVLQGQGLVEALAAQPGSTARSRPVATAASSTVERTGSSASQTPASAVDRYAAARKLMNTTAVDALGLRAFLFTLKLEKCTTPKDLSLLLPEFTQALTKSRGDLFARRVADQVRALLD